MGMSSSSSTTSKKMSGFLKKSSTSSSLMSRKEERKKERKERRENRNKYAKCIIELRRNHGSDLTEMESDLTERIKMQVAINVKGYKRKMCKNTKERFIFSEGFIRWSDIY